MAMLRLTNKENKKTRKTILYNHSTNRPLFFYCHLFFLAQLFSSHCKRRCCSWAPHGRYVRRRQRSRRIYCRALTDIRQFFEPRRGPFFWLFLSIISIEGMLNDCFLPITRTVAVVFIRDDHTLQN